ncbi:MAG: hypothetical protein VX204_04130 [Candidatus Thermoplasmatota archaeon]|nr:hypothetical protein [Candidatus Thermoplasmatota archaeon]MEE3270283.1 hypothetical protein [Candidatus Thermoplasmatota archaeon]
MEYSDLVTLVLIITALLLIRQLMLLLRVNDTETDEEDYTGRALDPETLTRVDEDSIREFDRLIDSRFPKEE